MFDSFDYSAKAVIKVGIQEANLSQKSLISPGFLLLGVLRRPEALPSSLRTGLRKEASDTSRALYEKLKAAVETTGITEGILFSDSSQRVFRMAFGAAQQGGLSLVNAEHLCFGLARLEDAEFERLVRELQIDLKSVVLPSRGMTIHPLRRDVNASPFSRFNPRIRNICSGAKELSDRYKNAEIDVVHYLLSSLGHARSASNSALNQCVVNLKQIATDLEESLPPPVEAFEPPVKTPFSVAIKAVFHVAARIADECGDPLVDTMHVLLGVLKEETNIGSQVLARAGISYARVREFASEVLEPELSPEDFTVGPEASRASVERLRFLLSETYHCDVVHLETKIVAVAPGEEEVCNGIVEMFRMVGHPEVTGAFAWEKVSVNGGVPKVSVFQIPMSQEIQTPSEAITSEYRHRKAFMG